MVALVAIAAFAGLRRAAETVIYSWPTDGVAANKVTLAEGVTVEINGNTGKSVSNGIQITVNGTQYTTMKVSNGAQNTLTLSKKAKAITFYSYVNKNASDAKETYWKEVAGVDYTAETSGGKMACFKDGDLTKPDARRFEFTEPISVITFTNSGEQLCYIVEVEYEAEEEQSDDVTSTYVFTAKDWAATKDGEAANWTSVKDGGGFSNNGVQVTAAGTGASATSPDEYDNISKIVVTYNTNKSKGAGTLDVKIGANEAVSKDWAYSGSADGTSANFTAEFDYATPQSGAVTLIANTTTNSIYVVSIAITHAKPTPPAVEKPTFSLAAGTYAGAQKVEIACATEDAKIYYTTDGTEPTAESAEYTTAIDIATTATVKAIAIKGEDKSKVATATYTIIEKIDGGTAAAPLTIAQAKELIDTKDAAVLAHPDNKVYVKGKVSQVDKFNESFSTITYWISEDGTTTDQFEVYSGLGLNGAKFTSIDEVAVGADVVIVGNIKKFTSGGNTIYEFDKENQLASYEAPVYNININPEIANGTVTASPEKAEAGTEITLTAIPAEGYKLLSYTVRGVKKDEVVPVTNGKFTMPKDDVTVSAVFAQPENITIGDAELTAAGNDITAALAAVSEVKIIKNITINLAENGVYSVSAPIEAGASISINGNGAIIDASGNTTGAFILMSKTPVVEPIIANNQDTYCLENIAVKDVTINDLKGSFFYDNNIKYRVDNFTINNVVLKLNEAAVNWESIIAFQAGGSKTFAIKNSTVYGTGTNVSKYFFRYGSNGRLDRLGYDKSTEIQSWTYDNNTFYNVLKSDGQWGNGQNGQSYMAFYVHNNIWFNCGDPNQSITTRLGFGRIATEHKEFVNNTYFANGQDNSSKETANEPNPLTTDPGFDAEKVAAGDFTIGSTAQQAKFQTGDPRWMVEYTGNYTITNTDAANGSYTVKAGDADITEAAAETVVTITATPDENYELDQIKVEGTSTDLEVIVAVEGNVGTFTMPDADVIVTVTFKIATGINSIAADKLKDATIYTIGGQRVNSVKRGLYIINGKKVVIK